jgi:hypothetical protein
MYVFAHIFMTYNNSWSEKRDWNMKLLLTSFGVSHLRSKESDNHSIFYRMPPVSMSQFNQEFLPDYAVLLLTNEVIMDKETYERLMTDCHESYNKVAVMTRALYDEGFIHLAMKWLTTTYGVRHNF